MQTLELNKTEGCKCSCDKCKAGKCSSCSAETKCGKTSASDDSSKSVKYLVTESDGTTHLPYTNSNGKVNRRLLGAAYAALFAPGGHRGNKYAGPNISQAKKKIKQIYASNGWDTPTEKAAELDEILKTSLEDAIQSRAFGQLNKGLYTVGRFAEILESLKYLYMSLVYEKEQEGDESPATDELGTIFEDILAAFLSYAEEQVEEELEHHSEKIAI